MKFFCLFLSLFAMLDIVAQSIENTKTATNKVHYTKTSSTDTLECADNSDFTTLMESRNDSMTYPPYRLLADSLLITEKQAKNTITGTIVQIADF